MKTQKCNNVLAKIALAVAILILGLSVTKPVSADVQVQSAPTHVVKRPDSPVVRKTIMMAVAMSTEEAEVAEKVASYWEVFCNFCTEIGRFLYSLFTGEDIT